MAEKSIWPWVTHGHPTAICYKLDLAYFDNAICIPSPSHVDNTLSITFVMTGLKIWELQRH
jgi:hypothetical protein